MTGRTERNRLLQNSSWLVASQVARAAELLLRSVLIARALGIECYAHYVLLIAFVGPIQELCNTNIGATIIRFGAKYEEEQQRPKLLALYKASCLLTSAFYLLHLLIVALAFRASYGLFFEDASSLPLVVAYGAASGLSMFDAVFKPILRLHDRFRVYAMVEIAIAVMMAVCISVMYYTTTPTLVDVVLLVSLLLLLGSFVTNVSAVLALKAVANPREVFVVKLSILRQEFRELFRFTVGNSIAVTIERATRRCDILLLGALAPSVAVANYDVARKIANSILLLRDPLSMAAFPQVSRMIAARRYGEFIGLLEQVYRILTLPVLIFLVLAYFFAGNVASLWGNEFSGASTTTFWLTCRAALFLLFFWTMSIILSLGQVRFQLGVSLITTVVGFMVAIPATLWYGDVGMAVAMFLTTLMCQVLLASRGVRQAQRFIKGSQPLAASPTSG